MKRVSMYNYDDKLDEQDFEEMCEETNINYVQDLENKIAILEKALDKACEIHVHTCIKHNIPSLDERQSGNNTCVQEFKEHVLKESEKE